MSRHKVWNQDWRELTLALLKISWMSLTCLSGSQLCMLLLSCILSFRSGEMFSTQLLTGNFLHRCSAHWTYSKNYIYPFTSVSLLSRIWVGSFIPAIEVDTNAVGVCTFIISFTALLLSKPPKAVAFFLCLKGDILNIRLLSSLLVWSTFSTYFVSNVFHFNRKGVSLVLWAGISLTSSIRPILPRVCSLSKTTWMISIPKRYSARHLNLQSPFRYFNVILTVILF